MSVRVLLLFSICVAALGAELSPPLTPAGTSAESQPASAAAPAASAASSLLSVQILSGDRQPGQPARARLQIAALRIDLDTTEDGVLSIPGVPKGKLHLKVLVAGAAPCEIEFDSAGEVQTTAKVFVPKLGRGTQCGAVDE